MILYAVHRYGVYDQGVVGIFGSRWKAEKARLIAITHETDGHHDFDIRTYVLDKNYSRPQEERPYSYRSCPLDGEPDE